MRNVPSRQRIVRMAWLVAALLAIGGSSLAEDKPEPRKGELHIEVTAGKHDRQGTPLFLELPNPLRRHAAFSLERLDTGAAVDAQVLAGEPSRLVWILDEPLSAGSVRRYRLVASDKKSDAAPAVTCRDDGKQVLLAVGDRPVLRYNEAVVEPPEGVAAHFRCSGFIHPLFSPAGKPLTTDFPPDHLHQHAIFFAWVNTTFEGRKVDFWNQAAELGRVDHAALEDITSGPVFGQFVATLRHTNLSAPEGPKAALKETWTVRVYNVTDQFLVDFESRQRCTGDSPLIINEYHYGGMGIRGNQQWRDQPQADFLTSEGKGRKDGNHTRPRWVEIFGQVDGHPGGILVMDNPKNFRFPQPVRLHPTMPYFCFAPMVLGEMSIKPGEEYVSRYRYCTHDGKPDVALAERLWKDYADPPRVRLLKVKR